MDQKWIDECKALEADLQRRDCPMLASLVEPNTSGEWQELLTRLAAMEAAVEEIVCAYKQRGQAWGSDLDWSEGNAAENVSMLSRADARYRNALTAAAALLGGGDAEH